VTPADEPLWPPGWEVEPCDTASPPATARRRTHVPRRLRDIETVPIPIDQYPEGAGQCPDPT
jgi:hypothetical protein